MADQLIRATAADGGIKAVGVISTRLTEEARQRHKLSYVATAALGRTMAAGLLMAASMKRSGSRVNVRVKGDGPLGGVLADAGLDGTVRGYVGNPSVELPPNHKGKLDVGGAVGAGFLYVVRDLGHGYPYSSTVELVSGEIGDDVAHYLASSEQTPSALVLGVFVGEQGVTAAGGILIQVLPKAARDEELVATLESRVGALSGFTPLLQAGKTLTEIFNDLLGDMGLNIFPESQMLRFHCGCSFDRVLGALKILGEAELQDMIVKDDGAEATCDFCGNIYQASSDDLTQLIGDIQRESLISG
ncbi:Hsp33 family molecular chaperone HslO [Dolichospermum sp. LEGE 00240]|jgi:molecular chaperone Hsp33|uniref:Hsp33 family molecular chaperone HslO n=1 Tax=Aphanizomenonaceae TaxID=1892259 RepID=UPI00187FABA1|nr:MULTISPECIES: Hsp33 family molecular chaperone HslO [Aphanizomenonaceae]MDM3844125.1 Hsp33 family molecular chaperone HslO [Aphanizomenon gracile PMC638.10]MDM3848524.1 Hsp33 family molecular chaperone HslO [Aphanizomenon gracile PMC627.10]MDM3861137.1 Hsp33 family molecular chaperone HslO [Aphanizomenon gracile PMC644.10]MBE9249856.1 Hsp33 family molecular chaperone HslO [Dolichospermum sp. LEGE 00240]MDB9307197.1 Hsp33 family molecular chaperone HslO [Aphanizomenon sp. CS-733/32]